MRGGLLGFLITLAGWVLLALVFMGIELLRGQSPAAMFAWNPGGRYIAITVACVLALGAGIGVASDRMRRKVVAQTRRETEKEGSVSPG